MTHHRDGSRHTTSVCKGLPLKLYLLLPLFSSVTFVFGMMFARQAIQRGAKSWTGTFYTNLWLGLVWLAVGLVRWDWLPVAAWGHAALIGVLFFLGQLFLYLAYRFGDVSVATPIFGVKILFVAILSSVLADQPVPDIVWVAAVVATLGVVLVQAGPTHRLPFEKRGITRTVLFSLSAAFTLSIFDVFLQRWCALFGTLRLLPVTFAFSALATLVVVPWIDSLPELRVGGALRPMLMATILMALQALGMSIAIAEFGDATRVNIVYALRGLWAVALAWIFARGFEGAEQHVRPSLMLRRAVGAVLLTAAVIASL